MLNRRTRHREAFGSAKEIDGQLTVAPEIGTDRFNVGERRRGNFAGPCMFLLLHHVEDIGVGQHHQNLLPVASSRGFRQFTG